MLQQQMGFPDFLTGETIIESASVEQNINGDGKLSLSWKSLSGGVILNGTVINTAYGKYVMMEPYTPTVNNDGTYSFSPSFTSWDALASKRLFSMVLQDSEGNDMRLYTFPYTGQAYKVSDALADFGWNVDLNPDLADKFVTISFDGDTVKSAAEKLASALGTNAYYVNGTICIGTSNAFSPESYYNCFVVLGGTRNMAKKTIQNSYAQVTQRLTLDANAEGVSAGSVIDLSGNEPKMEKLLIFDDVYPKMELVIADAVPRRCYMMDESGQHVVDHWVKDGVIVSSDTPGATAVDKEYTKWYIRLGKKVNDVITIYDIPTTDVIENKELGLLFQDGALAGREFDLAVLNEGQTEHMSDDVLPGGFTATGGTWYRIIMVADHSTLIPNNNTLIPIVGNRVTPINVKFDSVYTQMAKAELLERAMSVIPMYHTQKSAGFQAQRSWSDFLTGGSTTPDIGDPYGNVGDDSQAGYIVTSVVTDLMTGAASITYGTFKRKGLLSSMADKIDSVQLSGGQATVGQVGDDVRHTAQMGIDQYNALRSAGGALGMISVNQRINEISEDLESYGASMTEVEQQMDRMFLIHFINGVPLPNVNNPNATANAPASEWTTAEDKALHVQDICYDMSRDPASNGGRAWRWMEVSNAYLWVEITDADTLAALEKIADVASDGVLSAGTEKVRILGEWTAALDEYTKCLAVESTYGTNTAFNEMKAAFARLGRMLNGDEPLTTLNGIPQETPAWLADLTERTVFKDEVYTDAQNQEQEMTSEYYRATWDNWYEKLAALKFAITGQVNTEARSKMQFFAGNSVPQGNYKIGDMWRHDGKTYICTSIEHKDSQSASERLTDWQEITVSEDIFGSITNLLSEMTILIAPYVNASVSDVRFFLSQTTPTQPVNGELWFDGADLYQYDGTAADWNELADQQGSTVIADAKALLVRIASMIGLDETITFRHALAETGVSRNLYDIYTQKAVFYDNFTGQNIEGGLAIWIYGRHGWEHIIDNTTGLLQNYGSHIVNAVFGSDAVLNQGVNYASSMVTSKTALDLFSRMTSSGKTLAEALFALGVDVKYYYKNSNNQAIEVVRDGNGWKEAVSGNAYSGNADTIYAVASSNAKLSADKIDFNGKEIIFASNDPNARSFMKLGISGGTQTYSGSSVEVGTVELAIYDVTTVQNETTGEDEEVNMELFSVGLSKGTRGFYSKWMRLDGNAVFQGLESKTDVAAASFVVRGSYLDQNDDEEFVNEVGVGDLDAPVTFTTADGKTVTVMGGIIIDVS